MQYIIKNVRCKPTPSEGIACHQKYTAVIAQNHKQMVINNLQFYLHQGFGEAYEDLMV